MDTQLMLTSANHSLNTLKYCLLLFDHTYVFKPHSVYAIDYEGDGAIDMMPLYDQSLHPVFELLDGTDFATVKMQLYYGDNIVPFKNYIGTRLPQICSDIAVKSQSIEISSKSRLLLDESIETIDNLLKSAEYFNFFARTQEMSIEHDLPIIAVELIWHLYTQVFVHAFSCINEGFSIINESTFIDNLLHREMFADTHSKQHNVLAANSMLDCIQLLFPNVENATIEDILEIRTKAADELIEMRLYLSELPLEDRQLAIAKAKRSIDQFRRKLENSKLSIGQLFIKELKNPSSYAPLIATLFGQVSWEYTLAASLSLIAVDCYIEIKKKGNELKNESLYFIVI